MKQYDRPLLEIFAAEQAEHVQRLRILAETLATAPPEGFDEALRRAHTLKGAARAVGVEAIELLTHRLEALLAGGQKRAFIIDQQAIAVIHHVLDALEDILASVLDGRAEPDTLAVSDELDLLLGGIAQEPSVATPPESGSALPQSAAHAAEFVRVNTASIDALIRASSQMLASSTAESLPQKRVSESIRRAEEGLTEFLRFRRECTPYLRRHEYDPEITAVRECLDYADQQLHGMVSGMRAAAAAQHDRDRDLRQQATQLHQNAVRVRMIPAESVFGAFGTMVREIAHKEGKEVEFRAEGLEAQADRVVLQSLKDPVMHLLRNAVSHGIEPPSDRVATGKPAAGTIRLKIAAAGDRLHIAIEDDGCGLDLRAVARQAVQIGLLTDSEVAAQTPEELSKLIFRPGFSTSKAITSVSGRGLGLSVAEQAVSQLQGEISIQTELGIGLKILISVALSISTQHVLLLTAGGHTFGLPTRFVRRLCRVRLSELESVEGREVFLLDSQAVPLARLADLLELPATTPETTPTEAKDHRILSIAVVESGEQTAGLIADRFLDDREVVVKDLGLLPGQYGLSGGGIPLDDGTVAILLNPNALFGRFLESAKAPEVRKMVEESQKTAPRILVVDDSITTRSLEKSILEAYGYRVAVAVDGLEALERLSAESFDLVITDVLMPRMDGLQLLQEMKKQKRTEQIPVIVVTSLERREDQERGLSLGADAYIVKRKFDQRELLNTVRQIL